MTRLAVAAALIATLPLFGCGPAKATTYRVSDWAEFQPLLGRLRPGDVVDMGSAYMGDLFLRKGTVERLNGVTLRGGRFRTVRMDDATGVTLDSGTVVMPVNEQTKQWTPAMLFYKPSGLTIRNYDISSDRHSGFRLGYGIRIDQRGGGSGVTVEDTRIHDILSGIHAQGAKDLTLRRVSTDMMSGDSFFISNGSRVTLDSLTCGRYDGTNQTLLHSDCIQVDEVAGPTNDLLIRNLRVNQGSSDFTQWIFAGMPRKNFRHARWTITGTRGMGLTYRAISVAGIDGLTLTDNVLQTPRNRKYFTMLTVDYSSDVEMSDNAACSHERKGNSNLRERGRKTLSCR